MQIKDKNYIFVFKILIDFMVYVHCVDFLTLRDLTVLPYILIVLLFKMASCLYIIIRMLGRMIE